MKRLIIALVILLVGPTWAEHVVEHGGRKILTFEAPQVEFRKSKEGKYTRTYFSKKIGQGNLKITVTSKGWMSEFKAETRYQADKRDKRNHQGTRLRDDVEVPGAMRTLCYSTSSPYKGEAIVVYTRNFRCELLVTGTEDAKAEVAPTYKQLLETLRVVPRTNISEIKIIE